MSQPFGFLKFHDPKITVEIELLVDQTAYSIGRSEDSDIVLAGAVISRKHCIISHDGPKNTTFIEDLGSANGTFVNGQSLLEGKVQISHGAILSLGALPQCTKAIVISFFEIRPSSIRASYRSERILGSGGFGVVLLAFNRENGQQNAIKKLRKSRLTGQTSMKYILEEEVSREIDIMMSMNHPHIINLHDIFDEEEYIYLVMELAPAGCLRDILMKCDRLCEHDAQPVIAQTCGALEYLHSQQVMHRDIKPENILVMSLAPIHVKLSDFGLSKVITGNTEIRTRRVGTPFFMAPEVWSDPNYDYKVDCWGVGVTTFDVLCGGDPFLTLTANGELNGQAVSCVDWDQLPEDTSKDAKDFINSLLVRDPGDRSCMTRALSHPWLSTIDSKSCDATILREDEVNKLEAEAVEKLLKYKSTTA